MRTIFENVWSQGKQGQAGVHDVATGTADSMLREGKLVSPAGIFWDPLNRPEEIGELRAGKNSIGFNWNVHSSDEDKWFNLDLIAAYTMWSTDGPYCGIGRPGTFKDTSSMDPAVASTYGLASKSFTDSNGENATDYADYTVPNYANMPLLPTKWFWKELESSVMDWLPGQTSATSSSNVPWWWKANKYWSGTEKESALYPPCQWFCKGIPLYDTANSIIRTSTQISFEIKLVLEGKKRRSAYYCPTYGPISGQQLYQHGNDKLIYQPACIRYRTAGMRRTWQNMCPEWVYTRGNGTQNQNQNIINVKKHPRVESFYYKSDVIDANDVDAKCRYNQKHAPTGLPDKGGANRAQNIFGHKESQANIRVTWNKATDTTEIIMENSDNDD